jgi:hypothetical protein
MLSLSFPELLVSSLLFSLGPTVAASKLALILVPGTFHRASVYDEVKSQLGNVGYQHIDAVDLPSNGYDVADVERSADVQVVTKLLENYLNDGEDVILVGNSYGATVIGEAVKDFEDRSITVASEHTQGEGRILGLVMVRTDIFTSFQPHTDRIPALRIHPHNRRSHCLATTPRHPHHRCSFFQLPRLSRLYTHTRNLGSRPSHLPALDHVLQPPSPCVRRVLDFSASTIELQSTQRYRNVHSV